MSWTFLVFGSDGGFRDGIAWCLRSEGHRVVTGEHHVEALRTLLVTPADLVLIDLTPPLAEARDLLRCLAAIEQLASIPVVVVAQTIEAAPPGTVVLTKPFPPERLVRTVTAMIIPRRRRLPTSPPAPAMEPPDPVMSTVALSEIKR